MSSTTAIEQNQIGGRASMDNGAKAKQVLLRMFEVIEGCTQSPRTRGPSRECFNQLVRFLADCVRIQPMPEEDHWVADRLIPLAEMYIKACCEKPWDYLGDVFAEKKCANERLGQTMTPEPIVRFINESTLGQLTGDDDQWKAVLDPCTGAGRFLIDAATHYPDQKLALYGVELDLDLYRAALVNMRTYVCLRPYRILCANALVVDIRPDSPNWRYANLWKPPSWEEHMEMEEGGTYAEWLKKHPAKDRPAKQVAQERRSKPNSTDHKDKQLILFQ